MYIPSPTMSAPFHPLHSLLEASEISKAFGSTQALRRARFTLERGEVHALVGENGAGKSTLMKILAGVHGKDEGRILMEGVEFNPGTPQQARSLGIATVFQELSLCNNLSVAENIFANREPGSHGFVNFRLLNEQTDTLLREFSFTIPPQTIVAELSLAHKQIVEILKAIALKAKILILDEPTSALERSDADRLFGLIDRLRSQGTGIIFISHKLDEVFRIADKITVFRDGEHIATLKTKDTSRDHIISSMIGREVHQIYPPKSAMHGKTRFRIDGFSLAGVFDKVTLELHEGEILGIAGLTGSGRTEVMQSVFAYRRRDSGDVMLDGKILRVDTPSTAIRNGIVYSPEDRKEQGLFLNHSVSMNITSTCLDECSVSGFVAATKESDVAEAMIRDLGIKVKEKEQDVGSLSGGNQQKVLLAKCLASQPSVLIVDEPTRGIDIGSKIEIYSLLRSFAAKGGSVILISSELQEVIGLSDRVIVFKEGRVVGELQSGLTEQSVMDLMFQRHAH